MRHAVIRILLVVLAGSWLAGCGSTSVVGELNKPAAVTETVTVEETVETTTPPPVTVVVPPPGSQAGLLGSNPEDDLSLGKQHYRQENYGLAEHYFRRAAENHPRDGED